MQCNAIHLSAVVSIDHTKQERCLAVQCILAHSRDADADADGRTRGEKYINTGCRQAGTYAYRQADIDSSPAAVQCLVARGLSRLRSVEKGCCSVLCLFRSFAIRIPNKRETNQCDDAMQRDATLETGGAS